jgi:hypothetical protein
MSQSHWKIENGGPVRRPAFPGRRLGARVPSLGNRVRVGEFFADEVRRPALPAWAGEGPSNRPWSSYPQ